MKRNLLNNPLIILSRQCVACWKCVDACPKKVIGKVNFLWHKHSKFSYPDRCIECLKCVKTCPHGAIITNPLMNK